MVFFDKYFGFATAAAVLGIVYYITMSNDEHTRLYGMPGQPKLSVAKGVQTQEPCQPQTCANGHSIKPGLFGINDGPMPYDLGLPPGYPKQIDSSAMGRVYKDTLGATGVRNDESGLAFDIRCMFPVKSLLQIPDPDLDENWDWQQSDKFFDAVVKAGLAPLLKIPVFTWNSPRITGLSYVNREDQTHYLIEPRNYANCSWPAIAPIINKIGHRLAKKIVDRYNKKGQLNKNYWKKGFAGVEIFNEAMMLRCGPPDNAPALHKAPSKICEPEGPSVLDWEWEVWTKKCYGKPWTWNGHYWDGTPQQFWDFYVKAYTLIKSDHPNVRVGGPALGTGPTFFPCQKYDGLGKYWVDGFLKTVKSNDASIDFFSFHGYTDSYTFFEPFYKGLQSSFKAAGFSNPIPMLLTEYNAAFSLSYHASAVGSMAGAATNVAILVDAVNHMPLHGAYVLDGILGAYGPRNIYTYPLNCHAKAECPDNKSSCEPEEVVIVPRNTWLDCNRTDMQTLDNVDPENSCSEGNNKKCHLGGAMATVFADGRLSPLGATLSLFKHSQDKRILPLSSSVVSTLKKHNISSLAWQSSDSRFASLILTNTGNQATPSIPGLISKMFPTASAVAGASEITQHQLAISCEAQQSVGGTCPSFIERWCLTGEEGIDAKGYLEGSIRAAQLDFGTGDDPGIALPALDPYSIVLLAIEYSDGCLCDKLGP